jgi:hypothetical protein
MFRQALLAALKACSRILGLEMRDSRTSASNCRAAWYAMSFSCGRVVQFFIVVLL